jgi:PAS domain S-box-containing protein
VSLSFIPQNQEMGRLALSKDWSANPLGPLETWPAALKTAVGMILNSHFPMFLTWGEQRTFLYNDAYIPVLGGKHPWAFGSAFEEIWSEIWSELVPLVRSVDRGQATFLENLKLIMKRHGYEEETYFTFSYSPLRDESGAVRGLFCACIEMTKQRQLEDSLRKSRESLKLALSSAEMGTWEVDLESGAVHYSEAAMRIYDSARDYENADAAIETFIHPDDRAHARKTFEDAIRLGHPYMDEYRLLRKDGELRWVHTRGGVHFDIEGRPAILTGIVMDTTEQRRAADTLAEARDRLELALVSSNLGFWDWNARTGYTFLSSTLMRDWGIDPATYGNTLDEALARIHPDDRAQTWANIEEATFRGKPYDVTYRVMRPSGEEIWVNAIGQYYRDAEGKPQRLSGITVNVTERRRAEEALRNAVIARDQFLSIASHELKTPLTSLKLQTQLHRRAITKQDASAYLPARVQALVEQTEKQLARLGRLVDDMLDVSRIRSGKLQLRREHFNLSAMAEEVVARLGPQFLSSGFAAAPHVAFNAEAEGDWDRGRLEQVVTNLLTNAIRYGKKQPVQILVTATKENVLLTVQDQGIGIASGAQEKIFDRFERAVDENEVSGLGLGLFITKQIILAHEGRIWVESAPGAGATFFAELPKRPAAPPEGISVV